MVSPVSFSSSPKVYFRGNDDANDIISAEGKYTLKDGSKGDYVDISAKASENKKHSAGKVIGAIAGTLAALTAASFGLFKWKGAEWLVKDAQGFATKCKKAVVKPGEFVNDKVIQPIIKRGRSVVDKFAKKGGADPEPVNPD